MNYLDILAIARPVHGTRIRISPPPGETITVRDESESDVHSCGMRTAAGRPAVLSHPSHYWEATYDTTAHAWVEERRQTA